MILQLLDQSISCLFVTVSHNILILFSKEVTPRKGPPRFVMTTEAILSHYTIALEEQARTMLTEHWLESHFVLTIVTTIDL